MTSDDPADEFKPRVDERDVTINGRELLTVGAVMSIPMVGLAIILWVHRRRR